MWPPRGIEPREGAELSKRVSVCQRSSQGAQAPQRSVRAARGRDSLPRHLELTRTSEKGSFSFMHGSAENASQSFAKKRGTLSDRLLPARMYISARHLGFRLPGHSSHFCATL